MRPVGLVSTEVLPEEILLHRAEGALRTLELFVLGKMGVVIVLVQRPVAALGARQQVFTWVR